MDVSQYLEIFIDETQEHIQTLNDQLMIMEQEPENPDAINEIFRAAHSLKGMAGTMGYKRMQHLTHMMENVLSEIRNGKIGVSAMLADVLFQCLDAIEGYLANIQESADEGTEDNEAIIRQLNSILEADGQAEQGETEPEKEEVVKKEPEKIVFAEFEGNAIREAFEKGMQVYDIQVFVEESCILKAARAFLVFKAIEENGEVMKSIPSVQDIEDEKFDFDFRVIVISKQPIEKVLAAIKNVSEVKDAAGEPITSYEEEKPKAQQNVQQVKEEAPKTEMAKTETQPQKKEEKKPASAGGAAKTGGSKPVVNRSVRVDIEKLDVLMNLVSELIIAKNGLVSVSNTENGVISQGFNEQIEYLERVTTNLHESVMKVRMMPIETVTQKFPRMIRDLNKKLDKRMELTITGEDTELDRTVIDEIGDPLMHLLRNSADHGLEANSVRVQRGKPEVGQIRLDAYQDGNNVVIEVKDDGNGIDVEKVKNKALSSGKITQEQADVMNDKEIIDLLFQPSFSTAEVVSDVSGRGVGLDVVKTKIEALGGDIEVKTKLGEGSNFIIRLPLTLAIIQALMVELGDEKYAISLGSIETIEDVMAEEIRYVQSKEVIHLRGMVIPIIRLDSVLDIVPSEEEPESYTVVIVKKGDKLAGLVVDRLIGQQEIVIKSLGKYINNNNIIGGATILGDGEVALILDANTLL